MPASSLPTAASLKSAPLTPTAAAKSAATVPPCEPQTATPPAARSSRSVAESVTRIVAGSLVDGIVRLTRPNGARVDAGKHPARVARREHVDHRRDVACQRVA